MPTGRLNPQITFDTLIGDQLSRRGSVLKPDFFWTIRHCVDDSHKDCFSLTRTEGPMYPSAIEHRSTEQIEALAADESQRLEHGGTWHPCGVQEHGYDCRTLQPDFTNTALTHADCQHISGATIEYSSNWLKRYPEKLMPHLKRFPVTFAANTYGQVDKEENGVWGDFALETKLRDENNPDDPTVPERAPLLSNMGTFQQLQATQGGAERT